MDHGNTHWNYLLCHNRRWVKENIRLYGKSNSHHGSFLCGSRNWYYDFKLSESSRDLSAGFPFCIYSHSGCRWICRATVRDAIQYGVARGLYSNDAGTGYGIIAHASAKTDHPVRQSSWGWGEIFLDTIVICSITAFSILSTDAYITADATSGALTTIAFKKAYGSGGGVIISLAIAVFAWTTIIGMYYACEKSVNYALGDTKLNKLAMPVYMVYYLIPCLIFYNIKADVLWAFTDILTAAYVVITLIFIYAKQKEIFRLFDDFWYRFLPAKNRGENPPPVVLKGGEE